jgi:hypothetical protein
MNRPSHPGSIEVAVTVRRALDEGVLPSSTVPAFLAFAHAKATLERFRDVLAIDLQHAKAAEPIAVRLVEGSLWTRYYLDEDDLTYEPHVAGPLVDDIVIVTAEPVVLGGRMSFERAISEGLVVIQNKLVLRANHERLISLVP